MLYNPWVFGVSAQHAGSPSSLESAMNIELDEVVVRNVSDHALELAAGSAQGGIYYTLGYHGITCG